MSADASPREPGVEFERLVVSLARTSEKYGRYSPFTNDARRVLQPMVWVDAEGTPTTDWEMAVEQVHEDNLPEPGVSNG